MITMIEAFAGIGSQTQALKNIGIEHKVIGIIEIDKYVIQAYKMLHGEVKNFGDITKIKSLPYCDLFTYSFPCQDCSICGNNEGIKKGTRSGLLLEVERLIEGMKVKPKYLLLENVKGLLQEKHAKAFHSWLNKLIEFGYINRVAVLNAKDYGIPQNRERVFVMSIREDLNSWFVFPRKQKLKIFLEDLLEKEVDEKYYISKKAMEGLITHKERNREKGNMFGFHLIDMTSTTIGTTQGSRDRNLVNTIRSRYYKDGSENLIQTGYINKNSDALRVYENNMARSLKSEGGGLGAKTGLYTIHNMQPRSENRPSLKYSKGGSGHLTKKDGTVYCIDTGNTNAVEYGNRIRRLTPLECFLLMGFKEKEYNKIKGISDTQKYCMAGNSIVVSVLEAIFKNLFKKNL
jgi:DNA (cytosine-5)-methyltransferase 1